MMTTNSPVFTPAQIEILNAVSHLKTEEEIKELQQAISHFFFLRAEKDADYVVSEDSHFNELKDIPFPQVNVLKVNEFMADIDSKETEITS
jgi:hypothetical protein